MAEYNTQYNEWLTKNIGPNSFIWKHRLAVFLIVFNILHASWLMLSPDIINKSPSYKFFTVLPGGAISWGLLGLIPVAFIIIGLHPKRNSYYCNGLILHMVYWLVLALMYSVTNFGATGPPTCFMVSQVASMGYFENLWGHRVDPKTSPSTYHLESSVTTGEISYESDS